MRRCLSFTLFTFAAIALLAEDQDQTPPSNVPAVDLNVKKIVNKVAADVNKVAADNNSNIFNGAFSNLVNEIAEKIAEETAKELSAHISALKEECLTLKENIFFQGQTISQLEQQDRVTVIEKIIEQIDNESLYHSNLVKTCYDKVIEFTEARNQASLAAILFDAQQKEKTVWVTPLGSFSRLDKQKNFPSTSLATMYGAAVGTVFGSDKGLLGGVHTAYLHSAIEHNTATVKAKLEDIHFGASLHYRNDHGYLTLLGSLSKTFFNRNREKLNIERYLSSHNNWNFLIGASAGAKIFCKEERFCLTPNFTLNYIHFFQQESSEKMQKILGKWFGHLFKTKRSSYFNPKIELRLSSKLAAEGDRWNFLPALRIGWIGYIPLTRGETSSLQGDYSLLWKPLPYNSAVNQLIVAFDADLTRSENLALRTSYEANLGESSPLFFWHLGFYWNF